MNRSTLTLYNSFPAVLRTHPSFLKVKIIFSNAHTVFLFLDFRWFSNADINHVIAGFFNYLNKARNAIIVERPHALKKF